LRRAISISSNCTDTRECLFIICDDDTIWKFDFQDFTWIKMPPIPSSHGYHMEKQEGKMDFFAPLIEADEDE
jgi:hypothetical protein